MTLEGQMDHQESSVTRPYEPPALVRYGTIEEWTHGRNAPIIQVSIVL